MHKVVEARSMNPDRATRIFGEVDSATNRHYDYGEWELPARDYAKLAKEEAAICLPVDVATRAHRVLARFVRTT